MLERLKLNNFDEEISRPGYVYVVFGIINCKPCSTIKNSIECVQGQFTQVRFWHFSTRALNTKELEKKYDIVHVPQAIIFKDGKEISRHLGKMSKEELTSYLNSVLRGG